MIYSKKINVLTLKTGDLICTTDGGRPLISGEFWRLIGKLIPGDVDHIAIFIGPDLCIESGPKGVVGFKLKGSIWSTESLAEERGGLIDTFYGAAYPLADKGLSEVEEERIRVGVAQYCCDQIGKKYNLNFFDSQTEGSFYCSQLAYKAYLKYGVDLKTGIDVNNYPGTKNIIFPQEIWNGCLTKKAN